MFLSRRQAVTGVPAGRREQTETAGEQILAFTGNLGFNRKSWVAQEILGFFELFATSVDHPAKFLSNG